jgi:hypothetical protein
VIINIQILVGFCLGTVSSISIFGNFARAIRRYLPANNPNIPRRVRTSRPKNSATETCVETFFSDTKHNDEKNINHKTGRQSISNDVVEDISSDQAIQIEGVTPKRQIKSALGECSHCQELAVDTILTAAKSNKADLKTENFLNFEISLPVRESIRYLRSQSKRGNIEALFTIKINVMTKELDYVKTGKESEWDKNSFYA